MKILEQKSVQNNFKATVLFQKLEIVVTVLEIFPLSCISDFLIIFVYYSRKWAETNVSY